MTTALFTHRACLGHDTGLHHPESPARLEAVLAALEAPEFEALIRHDAPLAAIDDIARVHPRAFIDALLQAVPETGYTAIDGDTTLSPGSGEAALRAVGAVTAAVDAVMTGAVTNAFCAVRPPGHHAEPERAMGFCLFNNIVIGARHAQAAHGAKRVAIIDFDVHHGNGTEAVVAEDSSLFYASTHQYPFYPGTGAARDTGLGNVVNVPMRAGSDGAGLRHAFGERILPALAQFMPDILLISAGFDGHAADLFGGMRLIEADFTWVTQQLTGFAQRYCAARLVSSLEGGYDLAALASSTAAHVRGLMLA